jgi:hypothetical protein
MQALTAVTVEEMRGIGGGWVIDILGIIRIGNPGEPFPPQG